MGLWKLCLLCEMGEENLNKQWKREAKQMFDNFNNTYFDSIIDVLQELNIELGSNATYYYWGDIDENGDYKRVDTRRCIYYRQYGLFKMYITVRNGVCLVKYEFIRKAEGIKVKIQDVRNNYYEEYINKLRNSTFIVQDVNSLKIFKDNLKNLLERLDSYEEISIFNKSNERLELKKITIFNFKSIEKCEIDFKHNLQLLVGVNNAVKTSLLQGVTLAQIALNKLYSEKKIKFDNVGYILNKNLEKSGTRIVTVPFTVESYSELFNSTENMFNRGIRFVRFDFQNDLYIELSMRLVGEYFSINISNISEGIHNSKLKDYLDKNITLIPSFFNVTLNEERKTKGRYISLMKSGNYNQLFRNILYDLKNIDNEDEVLEVSEEKTVEVRSSKFDILSEKLNQIFNVADLYVDFDEEHDEFISVKYSADNRKFDISSLGMGTLQFIQVVAQTLVGEASLIMLDEPDAHLNANLQKEIIMFFEDLSKEFNINLLIATHSKDIINCVNRNQVLIMDKGTAKRIDNKDELYDLFEVIGTSTEELIGLSIGKKIALVEGVDDIEYIIQLMKRFELDYNSINFKDFEGRLGVLTNNLDKYIVKEWNNIHKIVIFDKDYRFDEEQIFEIERLRKKGFEAIGWLKKEFENYLIVDSLIIRVLEKEYNSKITSNDINKIIEEYYIECETDLEFEYENAHKRKKIMELRKEKGLKCKGIDLSKSDEIIIRGNVRKFLSESTKRDLLNGKEILNRIRKNNIKNNTPSQSKFVLKLIDNIMSDEVEGQLRQLLDIMKEIIQK